MSVIVLILYEGHVPSIAILGMKTKVILVSTCLSTRSILKVLDISLVQISVYFTAYITPHGLENGMFKSYHISYVTFSRRSAGIFYLFCIPVCFRPCPEYSENLRSLRKVTSFVTFKY